MVRRARSGWWRGEGAGAEAPVVVDGYALTFPMVGHRRYLVELLRRLEDIVQVAEPRFLRRRLPFGDVAWQQLLLPARARGRVIWSPTNLGPFWYPRQVLTLQDILPLEHPDWVPPRFAARHRLLLPRLLRNVRCIAVSSAFTKTRLERMFELPANKVHVVHLGVDHKRFYPRSEGEASIARLLLDLPERYILSVSSPLPHKNLRGLLAGWAAVQDRLPRELHLVITGMAGISSAAGALPPRTVVREQIPDDLMPAIMSGAACFVFASLYEGFGLPPLEAMACGTPVVASDAGSLPEVLGNAALLVPPEARGLGRGMERVLLSKVARSELAERGLARAGSFSWDSTAARMRSLLLAVN
jgi:glycosyltransferase involved in cell wall biosynthesis